MFILWNCQMSDGGEAGESCLCTLTQPAQRNWAEQLDLLHFQGLEPSDQNWYDIGFQCLWNIILKAQHDFCVEEASACRKESGQVSVCCVLSGAHHWVHKQMVRNSNTIFFYYLRILIVIYFYPHICLWWWFNNPYIRDSKYRLRHNLFNLNHVNV